jgi:two-component system sensor histidine kinase KdpD
MDVPAWLRIGADTATGGRSQPGDTDLAAADWALRHGQPSGRFTDTLAGAQWWFLPLLDGEDRAIGVAGLYLPGAQARLLPEQRQLAEAMVDDIAQAALRTRLVAELEQAHVSNETERLRSALLSSVSHDLRSPLAAMIGSADSLASYGAAMDTADRRALLDTILVEGERLDRYIQNLLDMTRLGHEGLKINRDWIGVDELIGSAARRLQRYQPKVRLELDIPATLAPIWVHPALVEQAVFNVMENAAKFSPPDAAVQVQARELDGQLRIDVIDAGPGIPDDERARIFDMFYSVERGDRGRHGTGLGLTICQGMIGAHGGSVQALPGRDGRGTLIRITLPCSSQPPTMSPTPIDASAPAPRVLVIDDETQIRRFLDISLRAQGYQVRQAATGQEGLQLAASEDMDLVILDIGLPDMEGHEVLEQLRQWSQVPVIMLTVRAGEAERCAHWIPAPTTT